MGPMTDAAPSESRGALVLFSGGQDSTVCLAWALERFARVETLGFDYEQRHRAELDARGRVRERMAALKAMWAARLGEDHVLELGALAAISDTALTREVAIEIGASGLPTTFVPGRNLVFFAFAGALGYRRGTRHLVAGMCETDFSGYPDCRDDTIKAMQLTLNLGMDQRFVIHTPLMWIDKAATFALAHAIGGDASLELLVEATHTCYLGDGSQRLVWGYGCASCPACGMPEGCIAGGDGMGSTTAGIFGDILTMRMVRRGVTARVTDGVLRDKVGVLASSLPVWCAGVAAPASVNGLTFIGWQEPIGCGGCAIFPGDIIVADDDGAVVIPQNLLAFVADEGAEQERMEGFIVSEVERGAKLPGLYPMNEETKARYAAWKKK